ncbi:hypothetical protein BLOT_008928 [Blomia tropicalis]|nr:hypothetical protein BLOT_008928 [Blomia tropicalis]
MAMSILIVHFLDVCQKSSVHVASSIVNIVSAFEHPPIVPTPRCNYRLVFELFVGCIITTRPDMSLVGNILIRQANC